MDVAFEDGITINKAYAAKYEAKKRAEELSKLRDQYGDVPLEASESSSSEEEEDEDAEMLTADVEKDFLRTLSLIHSRDPRIYDNKTQFFRKDENKEQRERKEEKKENKPMFLKDYERKQLLERGVMAGVSDSEEDEEDIEKMPATYQEEQEQVKAEFHQAAAEEEEGESLLTLRKKGKEEIEEEERGYVQWLKGERERMEGGEEEDFSGLRSLWSAPDLDSGETFLRDYILNRRFVDRDTLTPRVPSYDEIVGGDSEEEGEEKKVGVSEDEDALDRQEEFERKFNFRFEEPGGDQITSYPRTVLGSVRREDERRKEKRKEREERREREKEQKQEELKRLKKLKRKEIRQKLDRIKRITGNPNVGFSEVDLEGDFDPASYDQTMGRAFDDEYYVMEEEEGGVEEGEEEGKPVFSDDEDGEMYGDWDQWDPQQDPHCEDLDFNMDADFDPETVAPPTKKSKLRRHRHKLAQAVSSKKPQFDPEEKTFEEYFDEYYSLDYEDVIGDMPCRFKYNQVPSNSFGLTVEEMLACEDKELNQWASLRKAVQIRTEEEEERDKRRYKKQARNFKKKYQILASLKEPHEEQEQGNGRKPRKRKASKSIDREVAEQEGADIDEEEEWVTEREEKDAEDSGSVASGDVKSKPKKKKRKALVSGSTTETDSTAKTGKKQKKKKKKPKVPGSAATKLSTARLKSYGL